MATAADDAWVPDDAPLRALLDPPARREALQGTWLVANDRSGPIEPVPLALTITSDVVTTWDGRTERRARLDSRGPCELALMRPTPTGEAGATYRYRVHDGVAEIGQGAIGERLGDGAMVCQDAFVYFLLGEGRCARRSMSWFLVGSRPASDGIERADCGFRRDGDQEVFFIVPPAGTPGAPREYVLPVDGWRIGRFDTDQPGQPPPLPHTRVADAATARALVDADARANDPVLIAQAAGGVIGDTTTVPGLVATYADASSGVIDTTVRVRATVIRGAAMRADDSIEVWLAAPGHPDRPRIYCIPPLATPLADGAAITVEGKVCAALSVDWTQRRGTVPALCGCAIVADGGAPP
ncbi:MAG: hypothetical protein K8W52_39890 [Deltaproteobacteria bacterium]|nr:hypothetical protein [Deltaproteobacteria bacterium]